MSILTRDEFHERMLAYGGDVVEYNSTDIRTFAQGRAVDTSAGRVMAAYDAALARIAELEPLNKRIVLKLHDIVNRNPHPEGSLGQNLEDVIDRQITALMRENELLGQHNARLQQRIAELESPAYRARIAREFLGELTFRYTDIDLDKSAFDCFLAVLDEWEAAAKEGV